MPALDAEDPQPGGGRARSGPDYAGSGQLIRSRIAAAACAGTTPFPSSRRCSVWGRPGMSVTQPSGSPIIHSRNRTEMRGPRGPSSAGKRAGRRRGRRGQGVHVGATDAHARLKCPRRGAPRQHGRRRQRAAQQPRGVEARRTATQRRPPLRRNRHADTGPRGPSRARTGPARTRGTSPTGPMPMSRLVRAPGHVRLRRPRTPRRPRRRRPADAGSSRPGRRGRRSPLRRRRGRLGHRARRPTPRAPRYTGSRRARRTQPRRRGRRATAPRPSGPRLCRLGALAGSARSQARPPRRQRRPTRRQADAYTSSRRTPRRRARRRSGSAVAHVWRMSIKKTPRRESFRWWAYQDLNLGPHPYQGCALTV